MSIKLLLEHHLEFLSLKGGRIGSSESTLVKTPHCWKSHVVITLTVRISVKDDILELFPLNRRVLFEYSSPQPVFPW